MPCNYGQRLESRPVIEQLESLNGSRKCVQRKRGLLPSFKQSLSRDGAGD